MTKENFINQVLGLSADMQNAFLAKVKNILSPAEYEALCVVLSYESMGRDYSKYTAMKEAVKAEYMKDLYR